MTTVGPWRRQYPSAVSGLLKCITTLPADPHPAHIRDNDYCERRRPDSRGTGLRHN